MQLAITGVRPPGRAFDPHENVHVGVQVRRDPAQVVPADVPEPHWEVVIDVVHEDGARDFRGPAVQGKRGDRFVYLTWGEVSAAGDFTMFRRAKLMLDRVDADLISAAEAAGRLAAVVDLTDDCGGPRCARLDPPAIEWSVP